MNKTRMIKCMDITLVIKRWNIVLHILSINLSTGRSGLCSRLQDNTGYKRAIPPGGQQEGPSGDRPSWLTYTHLPLVIIIAATNRKVVFQNLQSLHLVQDSSGKFMSSGLTTHVASPCLTVVGWKKKKMHVSKKIRGKIIYAEHKDCQKLTPHRSHRTQPWRSGWRDHPDQGDGEA